MFGTQLMKERIDVVAHGINKEREAPSYGDDLESASGEVGRGFEFFQ
jgi:hypothetical protein